MIRNHSITVVLLFIITLFLNDNTLAQTEKHYISPVNPDFLLWLEQKNNGTLEMYTSDGYGLGYIPPYVKTDFSDYYKNSFPKPAKFPSIYDLRTLGLVTSVKDQIFNGPCWTFAALGSIESNWLKSGYGAFDLSEKNMVTCHGFDYGICLGGNDNMAAAYLTRGDGPISESDDPYSGLNCNSSCDTGNVPQAWIFDSRFIPSDTFSIKQALIDYGAIASNMYHNSAYYNSSDYTYYYNGTNITNHGILVVGWDDTKVTAGGTGAWIIKNSWGTSFGENGYFYVSYNDTRILTSNAVYPVRNNYEANGYVYYYDECGRIMGYGFGSNTAYGLVKYDATNNHQITKIITYATSANTIIDIHIYDDFNGSTLTNLLESLTNQVCPLPGYYSFDLNNSISVANGNDFYIKIMYNTPGNTYPIPIEVASPGYITNPVIETGKCWVSTNGNSWTQIGNGTPSPYDLSIKAYGININQPIADFSASSTVIRLGDTINFTDLSVGNPTSWVWSFPGGSPSSSAAQNPANIIYNYAGVYNVSLSVTNIHGSHTLTKVNYITVIENLGCDTITNFVPGDQSVFYNLGGTWGYLAGHNGVFMSKYADKFTNSTDYLLEGIFAKITKAYSGSSSSNINIKIWNEGTGGKPGTEIYTKQILVDSLSASSFDYNYIAFDSMVYVNANYFVGFTITYPFPQDTVVNNIALNRVNNPFNTAYLYYNGSWQSFGELFPGSLDNTSLDIKVLRCPYTTVPIADFSANNVNIYQGDQVNFDDLSTGNPGSWSWSFPGGTPSSSTAKHPTNIAYATAGVYDVSLIVTNAYGSDTITKTNYINVTVDLDCDTVTNFVPGDQSVYYYFSSIWGYPSGHNGYLMDKYADKFIDTTAYLLGGVFLKLYEADAGSPASFINVKVWDEGADGMPGNELYSKQVLIDTLFTSWSNYNYIEFDSMVHVINNYFVGFTLSYGSPQDTVVCFVALDRTNNPFNTAYGYYNGEWWSFNGLYATWLDNTSLDLQVLRCPVINTPVADFSANTVNIIQGDQVQFNNLSAGYPENYSWIFPGGLPLNSSLESPIVQYNNPGVFDVSLLVSNSNGSDSIYRSQYITVLPPGTNHIYGVFSYNNDTTPTTNITNSSIYLKTNNNTIIDSTNTDNFGYYIFANVPNGSYIIEPSCSKPWGGGNSADALLIMQHFVGMLTLQALAEQAAEVSGEGYVNSADALMVQRRFLGMIASFPAGDWVLNADTIVIINNSARVDFKTLCFGDVNGSHMSTQ